MILGKTPLKVYSNLKFLHTDYILHIGATQIVKVAFKFLLYLTLFPFFEVSLVLIFITILFWGEIIPIDNFTVSCLVAWPLNESEAGGDLVLIETSLLFSC